MSATSTADGTVTVKVIPSNWRVVNLSPDTYQCFNGDSWECREIEYWSEETGRELDWNDFDWEYDHAGIVRALAEEGVDIIAGLLKDAGLESVDNVSITNSWSPREYNFTSDGFEMELTFDPTELRDLTPDFDVDDWAHEHYSSRDGFLSFVIGRLDDDGWRRQLDAEFRIEYLLAKDNPYNEAWDHFLMGLLDKEDRIYSENVKVTLREVSE